jgi:hypothetical protein
MEVLHDRIMQFWNQGDVKQPQPITYSKAFSGQVNETMKSVTGDAETPVMKSLTHQCSYCRSVGAPLCWAARKQRITEWLPGRNGIRTGLGFVHCRNATGNNLHSAAVNSMSFIGRQFASALMIQ